MDIFVVKHDADQIERARNIMIEELKKQTLNIDKLDDEFSENEMNFTAMKEEYWQNFSKLKQGKKVEYVDALAFMKEKYKSNFRLRHKPESYYACAFVEFSYCVNVYLDLIDENKSAFVRDILTKYKIDVLGDQLSFISAAKRVSTIYKKFGPYLDERWKYVVDIQTLSGIVTQTNVDFRDDIIDWVRKKEDTPSVYGDKEMYVSMMCEQMEILMQQNDGSKVSTECTLYQLITQPERWVTGGTTTDLKEGERNVVEYSEEMRKGGVKKTKALISVAGDVDKLINNILQPKSFKLYAAQKEELGKARTIVTGGDRSYFIMKYLFDVAFKYFKNGRVMWCPVYMKKEDVHEMHVDICRLLSKGYYVPPADADQFDKYQSKSLICKLSIIILNRMLEKLIVNDDPNAALYGEMIDLYKIGMSGATIKVIDEVLKWDGGMMSGWYVTIFFDSIISYCYMSIGYTIMEAVLGDEKEKKYAQGDDLMPTFKSKNRMLLWLYVLIKMLKIKFNISKFWTGNGRSEFLRRLYYPKFVTAYPVRPISKLIFQKDKDTSESNVLSEIAAKYDTLLSRGCDKKKIDDMMEKEVKKFIPNYKQEYVYSCIAFGGYGWTLNELKGEQHIVKEVIIVKEKKKVEIRVSSPASIEIAVAKRMNMEEQIEKKLKSQVKYNTVPPRDTKLVMDTKHFNITSNQVNYSAASGSLRLFRKAYEIDANEVRMYGPNIASVLATRRADGTEIVKRIITRCHKEGLKYIRGIVESGASYFGGGIPESYQDQHEYVCDRLVNFAVKSSRLLYIKDLMDCVAKNIYITSKDVYNTQRRDMNAIVISK